MTGIFTRTDRGYDKPQGLPEELKHSRDRHLVIRISQFEMEQLLPANNGMRGHFCLLKDYDGDTYELICMERG